MGLSGMWNGVSTGTDWNMGLSGVWDRLSCYKCLLRIQGRKKLEPATVSYFAKHAPRAIEHFVLSSLASSHIPVPFSSPTFQQWIQSHILVRLGRIIPVFPPIILSFDSPKTSHYSHNLVPIILELFSVLHTNCHMRTDISAAFQGSEGCAKVPHFNVGWVNVIRITLHTDRLWIYWTTSSYHCWQPSGTRSSKLFLSKLFMLHAKWRLWHGVHVHNDWIIRNNSPKPNSSPIFQSHVPVGNPVQQLETLGKWQFFSANFT